MLMNEYYFLGTARPLHCDCSMNADTGAWLPTVQELDIRKGLRKDPEHSPLSFSLYAAAWKASFLTHLVVCSLPDPGGPIPSTNIRFLKNVFKGDDVPLQSGHPKMQRLKSKFLKTFP